MTTDRPDPSVMVPLQVSGLVVGWMNVVTSRWFVCDPATGRWVPATVLQQAYLDTNCSTSLPFRDRYEQMTA